MRMSKQDRQGVRTATDIERKYNLGDISKNRDTGSKQAIQLQQVNQDLANFMVKTNAKIEELEENDKMWFYSGEPTLENYPAVDWNTNELKAKHMGDMYYDVDNGDMYIFKYVEEAYLWESCFGNGVDYDTAYNEGYEVGYTNGETIGYNNGYTDGVASVPNPLEYATTIATTYKGVTFPEGYELTLDVPNVTTLVSLLHNAKGIKKITLKGNTAGNVVSFAEAFRACKSLETIDLTEFNVIVSGANYMVYSSSALTYILGELDLSNCTNLSTMLTGAANIVEFRVKPNSIFVSMVVSSGKISAETVQSIVDGLATVETAQTLTLNSAITVSDTQKAAIEAKGWTLVQ